MKFKRQREVKRDSCIFTTLLWSPQSFEIEERWNLNTFGFSPSRVTLLVFMGPSVIKGGRPVVAQATQAVQPGDRRYVVWMLWGRVFCHHRGAVSFLNCRKCVWAAGAGGLQSPARKPHLWVGGTCRTCTKQEELRQYSPHQGPSSVPLWDLEGIVSWRRNYGLTLCV